MNARQVVIVCIRGLAIFLGIAAAVTITAVVLYRMSANLPWTLFRHLQALLYNNRELCWAIPIAVGAIALWLLQRPLARLIVPKAGKLCPECGYDLRKLKTGVCPECGYESRK